MARTKTSVGKKMSNMKNSKVAASQVKVNSPSTSSASKSWYSKCAGGNPACPRNTPDWQKPITDFFYAKASNEPTPGCSKDEDPIKHFKPLKPVPCSTITEFPKSPRVNTVCATPPMKPPSDCDSGGSSKLVIASDEFAAEMAEFSESNSDEFANELKDIYNNFEGFDTQFAALNPNSDDVFYTQMEMNQNNNNEYDNNTNTKIKGKGQGKKTIKKRTLDHDYAMDYDDDVVAKKTMF